ncbi:MAG: hypothetical protein NVS3B14_11610 [Ktedonobacteraceae bacterium]
MSMELDIVIDSCVQMLQSDPPRTREEIAQMLNRWEEMGYISRQMRALIVQRLRKSQQDRSDSGPSEDAQDRLSSL